MEHAGGQHVADQCIIHVQPGNALFLGDATYGRPGAQWDREAWPPRFRAFWRAGLHGTSRGTGRPPTPERFAQRIERLLAEA